MPLCWIFLLKRRRALSNVSFSPTRTSANRVITSRGRGSCPSSRRAVAATGRSAGHGCPARRLAESSRGSRQGQTNDGIRDRALGIDHRPPPRSCDHTRGTGQGQITRQLSVLVEVSTKQGQAGRDGGRRNEGPDRPFEVRSTPRETAELEDFEEHESRGRLPRDLRAGTSPWPLTARLTALELSRPSRRGWDPGDRGAAGTSPPPRSHHARLARARARAGSSRPPVRVATSR